MASLAWQAFGEGNGALTLKEVRERISKYRPISPGEDPQIGCILLAEPVFFPEEEWIPASSFFPAHTQVGKRYELDEQLGRMLWAEAARLGEPVLVTDACNRQCAMTGKKILPVLEAAPMRAHSRGGMHELSNGLCLRSD